MVILASPHDFCVLELASANQSYFWTIQIMTIILDMKNISITISIRTRFDIFIHFCFMIKLATFLIVLLVAGVAAEQAEDAAYLQMRRTACLVLSRYYSNNHKELLDGLIESLSPSDQPKFINKMYAVSVQTCESQISQSEVQEFYVETDSFNPAHLFYILSDLDYNSLTADLEMTREQEAIAKFAKKFDEEMQIRKEEKQAKEQEESGEERYEMKFLGLSLKSLPDSAKLVYVVVFAGIVIAALYYAFSRVDQKQGKESNKRRKSPKGDKNKKA